MDTGFLSYLQQLEIFAFFSGYALLFLVVRSISLSGKMPTETGKRMLLVLPYSYAIMGCLFIGLQAKNLYPDYSMLHMQQMVQHPFLFYWAILTVIFLIPFLSQKPIFSFLHSLVFLGCMVWDVMVQFNAVQADRSMVRNEMRIYAISCIANGLLYGICLTVFFLVKKRSK